MVADVRCVVTSRARARKRTDAERIVHASDVCDGEAACIEDSCPRATAGATAKLGITRSRWPRSASRRSGQFLRP
jgi:hypothetical protein